jgi:DNA polymerase III sliding clamp (beta) subunit (PCNA family)
MNIILPSPLVTQIVTGFRPLRLAKAKMPVLRCLAFAVTPGALAVMATDLDQTLKLICPLETDQGAVFLVPFDLLVQAAKEADGDLTFTRENETWTITGLADGVKLTHVIAAPPVEDFPPQPLFTEPGQPTPPGFIRTLVEAQSAASSDATRYILNSVYVTSAYVVATNGRQLYASNSLALKLPDSGIILPTTELLKVFAPDAPAELLYKSEKDGVKTAALHQAPWLWVTKVIEGNYPNWQQVVPKEDYPTQLKFSPEDAARVARVLPKMPGHADKDAPVTLRVVDNVATLTAGKPDAPVKLELPGVTATGPAITARFNREFLVSSLGIGFRQLQVRDDRSAIIMRDGSRTHLWMPLRNDTPAAPAAVPTPPAPAEDTTQPENPPPMNTAPAGTAPAPVNPVNRVAAVTAAPANRLEGTASPAAPAPTPSSLDQAFEQLQQAREDLRNVSIKLGQTLATLKDAARDHKVLERDYEGLKRNVRALRTIEV